MTINRANQTWPEDVMFEPQETLEHAIAYVESQTNAGNGNDQFDAAHILIEAHKAVGPCGQVPSWESTDEFERRQRGSASTLAALFIITLFVVCAVAVWPVLSALANVAK